MPAAAAFHIGRLRLLYATLVEHMRAILLGASRRSADAPSSDAHADAHGRPGRHE